MARRKSTRARADVSGGGTYPAGKPPPALSMPEEQSIDELRELADTVLSKTYTPFPAQTLPEDWSIDKIRSARKQHDIGNFEASKRLERVVTTDPRVQTGLKQRLAVGLPLKVTASSWQGGRGTGEVARSECEDMFSARSVCCPPHVRRSIRREMALPGIAICQVIWAPRDDGSRWDARVEPWPLEHVTWNSSVNRYQVNTTEGPQIIEHGHGKWIIFEPHGPGPQSWHMGALRAIVMAWADRTYAIRYRAQHAAAHGSPVPVGVMPEGMPTEGKEGKAYQRFIQRLLTMRVGGLRPFGSELKYLEPATSAWQVFDSIEDCSGEDILLPLIGQDGTAKKGTVYTAPMFEGVRFDLVELDHVTFETQVQTGLVNIWAAINFGSEWTPTAAHEIPDPEADAKAASAAKRHADFNDAFGRYKANRFDVRAKDFASKLATDCGVTLALPEILDEPAPAAPDAASEAPLTPAGDANPPPPPVD